MGGEWKKNLISLVFLKQWLSQLIQSLHISSLGSHNKLQKRTLCTASSVLISKKMLQYWKIACALFTCAMGRIEWFGSLHQTYWKAHLGEAHQLEMVHSNRKGVWKTTPKLLEVGKSLSTKAKKIPLIPKAFPLFPLPLPFCCIAILEAGLELGGKGNELFIISTYMKLLVSLAQLKLTFLWHRLSTLVSCHCVKC